MKNEKKRQALKTYEEIAIRLADERRGIVNKANFEYQEGLAKAKKAYKDTINGLAPISK